MRDKQRRQKALLKLVRGRSVTSQNEMVELMRKAGFSVTQASISRDVREIGLLKANGRYVPAERLAGSPPTGDAEWHADLVTGVEPVGANLIIIRTRSGAANTVAFELESEPNADIAGTIAGDDTIFLAVRSRSCQGRVMALLLGRHRSG
ncbi:MAG: arginine repressor [Myxococcales bacterium]|nr:arginine repressor [Myxococcales bacterium]